MSSITTSKPERIPLADLKEWIQCAIRGDRDAQRKLCQSILPQVFRIARSIVGQDHAEDVTQDLFVTLFSKLDQFRFESSFETWIHRMAANQSLQFLRKSGRERDRIRKYAETAPHTPTGPTVDAVQANVEVVHLAMGTLPVEQRALLHMKEVEGFGYSEISDVLGIPEGTVGSRLNKARRDFKTALSQLGWEESNARLSKRRTILR